MKPLLCTALLVPAVGLSVATARAQGDAPSNAPDTTAAEAASACGKAVLTNFTVPIRHEGEIATQVPIWQVPGTSAFFYEAGMSIDADGAPNAYNPDNTGLDDIDNAGGPGDWWALALDEMGEPIVQGETDPFPGFYVSTTALWDRTKDGHDPARYVDASKIPYIVLPGEVARETGARLGDFAAVFNKESQKMSYAIFADIGPSVGEGSVALAQSLGVRSDARRGGIRGNILYLVFPGSGNGQPRPLDEIRTEAQKLLNTEDAQPIKACTDYEGSY